VKCAASDARKSDALKSLVERSALLGVSAGEVTWYGEAVMYGDPVASRCVCA
jgi:hypothetical protein